MNQKPSERLKPLGHYYNYKTNKDWPYDYLKLGESWPVFSFHRKNVTPIDTSFPDKNLIVPNPSNSVKHYFMKPRLSDYRCIYMIWLLVLVDCFSFQLKLSSKLLKCIICSSFRTSNWEIGSYSLPTKVEPRLIRVKASWNTMKSNILKKANSFYLVLAISPFLKQNMSLLCDFPELSSSSP